MTRRGTRDTVDLNQVIREVADVFDSPEFRNDTLTGALVASVLRKAADVGSRRGSMLSQKVRVVIRRHARRPRRTASASDVDA